MLLKNVIKKGSQRGTPVPYTSEEAAPFAVERGVRALNTKEKIFWVLRDTIKVSVTGASSDSKGGYTATASGTAQIGFTDVVTDKFYAPKAHNVVVNYKSTRDSMGLPDIEVTSFELDPVSKNPRDLAMFPRKAPAVEAPAPAPKVEAKKPEPKKESPKVTPKPAPKKADEE